jgi:hypothetical protein
MIASMMLAGTRELEHTSSDAGDRDERKIAHAILAAGGPLEETERSGPTRGSANGWNRQRVRGVPIIGRVRGGGGDPGTDPAGAVLRSENGRRSG